MNQAICRWGILGAAAIAEELAGHPQRGELHVDGRGQQGPRALPAFHRRLSAARSLRPSAAAPWAATRSCWPATRWMPCMFRCRPVSARLG